jgi:hypothetical protein
LTFEKPPHFNEVIGRARLVLNVGFNLRLHERYDMGGAIDRCMSCSL